MNTKVTRAIHSSKVTLACILLQLTLPLSANPGGVELDVIVKDGDPAPGTGGEFNLGGAFVDNAAATAIDDAGTVFFFTATNASAPPLFNLEGIWSGTGAFVDDIAVDGQQLSLFQPEPEECEGVGPTCGMIWNTQAHFHVTPQGHVTLRTTREDLNGTVGWFTGPTSPELAPILTSNQVASFPYNQVMALQTNGGDFLAGPYIGSKPFGEPDGGLTDFVTPFIGGAAPFIDEPVTITEIYGTYWSSAGIFFGFNHAADRLFITRLSDDSEALYVDPSAAGPSRLLARTGETAAGIGFGEWVGLSQYTSAGQSGAAQSNDDGQGYFYGTWRNPSLPLNNSNLPRGAIWRFDGSGGPQLVASEYLNPFTDLGFATSEFANTAFDNITWPGISAGGDVLFYAIGRLIDNDGIPDRSDERVGLWSAPVDGGPIQLILRRSTSDSPGSPYPNGPNVPGTKLPGGEFFTGFGLDGYGLDEHGHLVFATHTAIYAEDEHGIRRVVENDQSLELGPGDIRTLSQVRVNTLGHVSGQTQAYRNHRLALRALFNDNSRAILRTRFLPPPPPPRLIGLEAVQVVQDWENSVQLFNGKKTVVRAHLRSDQPETKKIVLRVFNSAGGEFSFSPLPAEIPAGLVFMGPDNYMKRGEKWASANFTLPKAATMDSRITVQVVNEDGALDCQEVAGPVANDCKLTVDFSEPVKPQVKIISLNWNSSYLHRIDRRGRMDLIERLASTFPVTEVDWTDAEVAWNKNPTQGKVIDRLVETLAETHRLRTLDKCNTARGCVRMYYGAMRAERLDGLANLDGYGGTGFVPGNTRAEGRHTHSHEIGHNLDRHHSVGDPPKFPLNDDDDKVGPCGSTASGDRDGEGNWVKPAFPFIFEVSGKDRQTLGPMDQGDNKLAYGWDTLQNRIVDPYQFFDLMGYCSSPIIDMWPSTHTYGLIATKLDSRYSAEAGPAEVAAIQDYWVLSGRLNGDDVHLDPLMLITDTQPPDVSPPGAWEVRGLNAAGQLVSSSTFDMQEVHSRGGESASFFMASLPHSPEVRRIQVLDPAGTVTAELIASANPPTVAVTSPNGGETLGDEFTVISWTAADVDGDDLMHAVQYSPDNGATWQTLTTSTTGQQLEVATQTLTAGDTALVRVITTDGFHHAMDDSDANFTMPNNVPSVAILSPGHEQSFYGDDPVTLDMAVFDTEEGQLDDSSLNWSSSLDGDLGDGKTLMTHAGALSIGTHILTATATDSGGAPGQEQVTIIIAAERPEVLADLQVDLIKELPLTPRAAEPVNFSALIENLGPDPINDGTLDINLELTELPLFAGPQASILEFTPPQGWNCGVSDLTLTCNALDMAAYAKFRLDFQISVDREAQLAVFGDVYSGVSDQDGGNNQSLLEYEIGAADRVFADGFED